MRERVGQGWRETLDLLRNLFDPRAVEWDHAPASHMAFAGYVTDIWVGVRKQTNANGRDAVVDLILGPSRIHEKQ